MRRILLLIFIALSAPLFAEDGATASSKYNSGDYLGAAQAYQAEAEANPSDPYTLYNLANSYFKSGDSDKALVYYLRAFKILPRDADIRHNLAFALQATGQKLVPDGMPDTVFNIYNFYSFPELKGMFALFAWIAALCAIVYFFLGRSRYAKMFCVVSAGLLILFGVWFTARYPGAMERTAVVTVPRAELRSGPGDNFPVSLSVPRAHLLLIKDSKGDWDHVSIKDTNSVGWVLKKSIEEI